MIGTQEMVLIFLVIILLFGANKLPELARNMGKSAGEFKKAQREGELEIRKLDAPVEEKSVQKLASELGISMEGKDENTLINEIKVGIKGKAEKDKKVGISVQ